VKSATATGAIAGAFTEYGFFSTGAAKKLTVIGQQSMSPIRNLANVVPSSGWFDGSQCPEDIFSA